MSSTEEMTQQTQQKPGYNPKTADPKKMHHQPPFDTEEQESPGTEQEMNPKPDYGLESYKGSGKLKGKVAVVTGGDSGIGKAVCLAFAREGCQIFCCYLNEHEDAKETKQAVEACEGIRCVLCPGDIGDDSVCKNIIDTCIKEFGKINILVNNAAYQGKATDFENMDYERVLYTFKTNIVSMFSLSRYAYSHLKPGSTIINVGSIQAYKPSEYILDYATTKGAIVNFTKGLAQDAIKKGIRVNCVAPGPVWTPLVAASFSKEKLKEFGKQCPMERPAQPVELAPAFVFLASDDSAFVNGAILGVTGGVPMN